MSAHEPNSHMQVHSTVAEMERLGVTQAALMKEGRRVIRAALLQQIDPKPAAVPAQQAAEQPGEVDPAVVDGVNCSDKKAAEASVGLVFLLRWLQLHGQACPCCLQCGPTCMLSWQTARSAPLQPGRAGS